MFIGAAIAKISRIKVRVRQADVVSRKSIGNLVDELTICNIRIWMAEDLKRGGSPDQIVKATEITNVANQKRNDLIQAIDERLNQTSYGQGSTKMYGKTI